MQPPGLALRRLAATGCFARIKLPHAGFFEKPA
jgi:hypothetical protein